MSHLKESKATKLVAGLVGVTMTLSLFVGLGALTASAQGISATELVNLLISLGIIPPDKADLARQAVGAGGPPSGGFTFTRNLSLGSRGTDVMRLQEALNRDAATRVSVSGAGSPGNETTYFGPATKRAVIKFQIKYSISPAVGFVGSLTRGQLNLLAGGPTPPPPPPPPGPTPPPPSPGTGVTITKSPDQPTGTQAPENAARVPFTKFTLTAGTDGDVVIDSVRVERGGLGADAAFTGVVLIDQDNKQLGNSKTLDSNHQANVGEKVTIPRGTTKTFTVAGNMAANNDARDGQDVSFRVVSINTSATVSGSLPVEGITRRINSTLSLGSVTMAVGSLDPGAAATKNVGETGINFSAIKITAGTAEKIRLHSIRWNQASSAGSTDIANIVTVVDGATYPTAVSSDGKFYTSTFGSGIVIDKGLFKELTVKGDLTGGSGRAVAFTIDKNTDIYLTGEDYNFGIAAPDDDIASSGRDIFDDDDTIYFEAFTVTIDTGSITFENSTSVAAQNIAINKTDQPLGAFNIDVKGERINVASQVFTLSTSGTNGSSGSSQRIVSVTLVDPNGKVVAGPVDATDASSGTVTFTDTVAYPVGKSTYKLQGKLSSGVLNDHTVRFQFTPSTAITSITGETTNKAITASPSSQVSLNIMTAKSAALSISALPEPASQTVVAGASGLLVGRILLDASASGEDLKMNAIPLDTSVNSSTSNITKCVLYDGSTALQTGSNQMTSFSNSSTSNFTFDNQLVIPKGSSKTLDLKCSFNTSASGTYRFGYSDTASPTVTGVTSGQSATLTELTSASGLFTFTTSGTLAVALDASSPSYALANAGGTQTVSALRITGKNEQIRINEVGLQLFSGSSPSASTTAADLVKITLWDGTNKVGEKVFSPGSFWASTTLGTCTGCSELIVPRNDDKVLTIKAELAAQGDGLIGTPGAVVAVDWDGDGSQGTGSSAASSGGIAGTGLSSGTKITAYGTDSASSGVRVVKSVPSFEKIDFTDTKLVAGRRDLFKFKVTASANGQVGINKLTFRIATSSATSQINMIDALNVYAYTSSSYSSGSEVTGIQTDGAFLQTSKDLSSNDNGTPNLWASASTDLSFHPHDSANASTTVSIPAGQTYYFVLRGDVTLAGTTYNVSTQLQGDNRFYTPATRPYWVSGGGATTTLLATSTYFDNSADATLDDFIWRPHSTTSNRSNTANDYLNGYGVPGLGAVNTNAQILSN
ncbi:MAG: peptidoglycan-binding protein [Candidatus Taylorbacteria bacterium]|nr:peptidoglycan-binding protein [Candidatus Taylorbacteria bacterium]